MSEHEGRGRGAWARAAIWTLVCVVLALSIYHFAVSSHTARAQGIADFPIFLDHARAVLEGAEVYPDAGDAERYGPAASVYKFPPLYVVLLLPFAGADPAAVYLYHWMLQIGLYAAAVGLLLAVLVPRRTLPYALLVTVAALNYEPFFETLWRLQLETPILFLLALALVCQIRGAERVAGAAIAIAAMLKVYPVLLVVYLAASRRWRALVSCLATAATILVVCMIVVGLDQTAAFFLGVLPTLLGEAPQFTSENVSPARHFQSWGWSPFLAKSTLSALTLVLLGAAVWLVGYRRNVSAGAARVAMEVSLFVALMVFALPNAWTNYQLLLLLPFLVLVGATLDAETIPWGRVGLLALAYLPALFYAPCDVAYYGALNGNPPIFAYAWPCAQTPWLLGLVRVPRALHDAMVDQRVWTTVILLAMAGQAVVRQGRGIEPNR